MYGKTPLSNDTVDYGIMSLAYTLQEQTQGFCILSNISLKWNQWCDNGNGLDVFFYLSHENSCYRRLFKIILQIIT